MELVVSFAAQRMKSSFLFSSKSLSTLRLKTYIDEYTFAFTHQKNKNKNLYMHEKSCFLFTQKVIFHLFTSVI